MDAAALFRAGKRVYEVAAELGVAYATAHGWKVRLQKEGLAGLRSRGKPGPDKQLKPEQLAQLEELLLAGAQAAGYTSRACGPWAACGLSSPNALASGTVRWPSGSCCAS